MSGAETLNLGWLRQELQLLINFNPNQTDQDFAGPSSNANALLDRFLYQAYVKETNAAKLEIGFQEFILRHSLTWTASEQTKVLPRKLIDHQIYKIDDETDSIPGTPLWVGTDGGRSSIVAWRDRNTLQWGSAGPGSDRTLMCFYAASANRLVEASQEPELIPPQYRYLLVWSAAIIARSHSDEAVSPLWLAERAEWRQQYHLLLSRGTIVSPLGYLILEPGQTIDSF